MASSRVGLLIQNPGLGAPDGWSGLITDVVSYTVRRQVNQGGNFSIAVRASAQQASQIRTGWQMSLKEERMVQNGSITMPEWIMKLGRVLSRSYTIDASGSGILTLQGETWLGRFINYLIHTNQSFAGANLETILAGLATATGTGISNSVPIRTVSEPLTISLNDQTLLANLIKLAELTRTNLRETWESDVWEYTDQDDVPAMGGVLELGPGDLYLRQVERGDPTQAPNNGFGPGQYGVGIIQGVPTVAYDGKDVVNRVVGIGADYDGSELTLEDAVYPDGLYSVITGTGPDSKPYWYIEDTDSQAAHGLIEFHYVRTDVKNPSNDPTTKAAAKSALLAVTMNELLRRRSEIISLSVQVLNGAEIAALPGSRTHIRYKGVAKLQDGSSTWLDVDQFMLISARTDSGSSAGVRLVVLDLVAPTLEYRIPVVPDAIPIPTPLPRDGLPSFMPDDPIPYPVPPAGVDTSNSLPPLPDLSGNLDAYTPILDTLKNLTEGNGAYQPCCADPTTDVNAGVVGPIAGAVPPPPVSFLTVAPGDTLVSAEGGAVFIFAWNQDHAFDAGPGGTLSWTLLEQIVERPAGDDVLQTYDIYWAPVLAPSTLLDSDMSGSFQFETVFCDYADSSSPIETSYGTDILHSPAPGNIPLTIAAFANSLNRLLTNEITVSDTDAISGPDALAILSLPPTMFTTLPGFGYAVSGGIDYQYNFTLDEPDRQFSARAYEIRRR